MATRVLKAMLRRNRADGSQGIHAHDVARAYEVLFDRAPESSEVTQLHVRNHADVWSLVRTLIESPEFQAHHGNGAPSTTTEAVTQAYQLLFSREPESNNVVRLHMSAHPDIWSLLRVLMNSHEFKSRYRRADKPAPAKKAPCTTLDWHPLLKRFQHPNPPARPGYITNYLGVMTNVEYLADVRDLPGYVEPLPVDGGFHCSVSEWIAGLRGVELSGDEFVIVELGAGWAPWMVNLCRAAQMKGVRRTLAIGCEADTTHCQYATRHVADNGLTDCVRLFHGAIGREQGFTLFPIPKDAANDWAMRPFFCKTEDEANAILANPQAFPDHRGITFAAFHRVPCYTLADVCEGLNIVDVLHIDIQGTELDLVRHNLAFLKQRVRYLIIGTHGREIEGGLIDALRREGWVLEVEEPCRFDIDHPDFSVQIDGTQGWRNPALS